VAPPLAGALLALALLAGPATGAELVLDSVTATTGAGEVRLRVSSRASFTFEPGAGVLVSSGSWLAEYLLPNQLTRFGHLVGDFRATVDGEFVMRAYECVEGTLGAALLNASLCGNYRFGPNGIDEGGVGDDEVVGPPRTLADYSASAFDWDGSALELTLLPGPVVGNQLFSETALRLRLVPRPVR
jgi:hypothetical protein